MVTEEEIQINYITSILLLIICLIAIFANVLVFYLAFIRQKDKAIDLRLIRIIAVADFGYAFWGLIHTSVRFSTGDLVLQDEGWCGASLFINSSSILLSIGLVTILAALRFIRIVKGKDINTKLWYTVIIVYTIYSLFITVMAMIYTEYIPEKSYTWCQPWNLESTFDFSYLVITTITYGIQIILMTFFYLSITVTYTNRLDDFNREVNGFKPNSYQHLAPRFNISKTSLIIKVSVLLLFYHISITPYVIVQLTELARGEMRDALTDAILALTINCVNVVNPLFLILLHDPTRQDLNDIIDQIKIKLFGRRLDQFNLA